MWAHQDPCFNCSKLTPWGSCICQPRNETKMEKPKLTAEQAEELDYKFSNVHIPQIRSMVNYLGADNLEKSALKRPPKAPKEVTNSLKESQDYHRFNLLYGMWQSLNYLLARVDAEIKQTIKDHE